MSKELKNKENKEAGASYIITFYQNVQILNNNISVYKNYLVEFEYSFPTFNKDQDSEIPEGYKQVMFQATQNLRMSINQTYILLSSILKSINKTTEQKKLKKIYDDLGKEFFIDVKKANDYAIQVNQLLLNEIISDLLRTSHDFVKSVV